MFCAEDSAFENPIMKLEFIIQTAKNADKHVSGTSYDLLNPRSAGTGRHGGLYFRDRGHFISSRGVTRVNWRDRTDPRQDMG